MCSRRLVVVVMAFLAVGLPPLGAADSSSSYIARISAGLDVMDFGLAAGFGGGYRFAGPAGQIEVLADVYYSP